MSALDLSPSSSPEAAFRASYRRALAFPLYRNWELCEHVRADVAEILAGGRRLVCRVLLEIRSILERHEVYYVYHKIWIDDYCVWSQANAKCVPRCTCSLLRLTRARMNSCITQ
jgi:protein SHQ1